MDANKNNDAGKKLCCAENTFSQKRIVFKTINYIPLKISTLTCAWNWNKKVLGFQFLSSRATELLWLIRKMIEQK